MHVECVGSAFTVQQSELNGPRLESLDSVLANIDLFDLGLTESILAPGEVSDHRAFLFISGVVPLWDFELGENGR